MTRIEDREAKRALRLNELAELLAGFDVWRQGHRELRIQRVG